MTHTEKGTGMSIASRIADVPHPGDFIAEELEARGWLQRDLAYILGVPEQAVNMIVSGKRGISPDMAKALGDAFDVNPEFFTNLQNAFEMSRARAPDPAIAKRALFQGAYPVREMIKRGWLADTGADVSLLEAQLMRFFRKNDLNEIPYLAHAAKKKVYGKTSAPQLAWLFRVRQIASEMVVPAYSEAKLRDAVRDVLPRYLIDPEEARHVPRVLSECGVRYVIVETLPKALIDGVCFWLDESSPVIGMTTRFDRNDNYWFVLRHEIEHVLNRDGQGKAEEDVEIDVDLKPETSSDLPPEERKANLAAADFCAPTADVESFMMRKAPFISERDVVGFARRVGRHPGIVVGQLQYRLERPEYLTRLKAKIRDFVIPAAVVDGWGEPAPVAL
jgi:HTH-type transcriptional regulator / antitoxin HigA